MRAHAQVAGRVDDLRLYAPATILRDDRGVPHIVAENDHDLFFAQGYAEASDRLFQMDLLRRYMLGELAQVFGSSALASDERARDVPIRAIVQRQWLRLNARSRELLEAFSDGVNAAVEREPLPVEFRLLAYRPGVWTPQDSLAVGMATALDLTDDWNDIEPRDAAYRRGGLRLFNELFPFTDPCYDAPVTKGLAGVGPGDACRRRAPRVALVREMRAPRGVVGSNAWASGAAHTLLGRALLANDPHLGLRMPGVWYLVDLRDRNYHVAGASLPGVPGVILGHNEHVAWGATNGTVTSLSVYEPPASLDPAGWQNETFGVRFGGSVSARYYRTRDTFGVTTRKGRFVLVRWDAYANPLSPAQTFISLDAAKSIDAATAALAAFPGPTQNFVLADTTGRAAYVLAGLIPNDPVRARWFHPSRDLPAHYGSLPFASLPKVAPSRGAIVWTANNKMYGPGYSFALSPQFAPPYRAYRVAQLLRTRAKVRRAVLSTHADGRAVAAGARAGAGVWVFLERPDGGLVALRDGDRSLARAFDGAPYGPNAVGAGARFAMALDGESDRRAIGGSVEHCRRRSRAARARVARHRFSQRRDVTGQRRCLHAAHAIARLFAEFSRGMGGGQLG